MLQFRFQMQHPRKPSSKETFKQLQAKWYKKLKDSGFDDVEKNEIYLKKYSYVADCTPDVWNAKVYYYQIAEHFLNTHTFKSPIERIIWEYHTNGISVRNISKLLKDAKVRVYKKTAVCEITQKLRKQMFEEYGVSTKDPIIQAMI